MITLEEARALVLDGCAPLPPRRVRLADALGVVCASPVVATDSIPRFANSAMDGFALRAADTLDPPVRLRVVGSMLAGAHSGSLGVGEAMRIMTGAVLPDGADAVCMFEKAEEDASTSSVVIPVSIPPGTNVRSPGEDVEAGQLIFDAGTVLGPAHLGVLASLGMVDIDAHPRPTVGVMSTGDELVDAAEEPSRGSIRDANRPAIVAQVRRAGFDVTDLGIVRDDLDAALAALGEAAEHCDAVVSSGGVSAGDVDFVKLAVDSLGGGSAFSGHVAIKPGKPFAFAAVGERRVPVFGLAGNPVAAVVGFELFVRPVLHRLAGLPAGDGAGIPAIVEEPLARIPDGKLHLYRVQARFSEEGLLHVAPSGAQGSHQLWAMARANALALVPDGHGIRKGGRVRVLVLDWDAVTRPLAGAGADDATHPHPDAIAEAPCEAATAAAAEGAGRA